MKNEELISLAEEATKDVETHSNGLSTQATAILTKSGKVFVAVNDLGDAIVKDLKEAGELEVSKMVCVFKGGCVDLPSFSMRKALLDLCAENSTTQIILNDGVKPLQVTMPVR